ncbi:C6 zinc finger domain-containing protein [Colletotrichum higginsianum IMI 349063]|uniref:C6 zinc finger domain-containing protein n=1 Tax=Colletotrichum higginsianum (strain IMI 349063) TaxID=759273 RepID=A0A1B7YCQ3_COLHI|nr:C6 zinc finger domain-containing protein [Colletotrichum higginsianum IMI 349063]OBR09903.1 C6 zinc finger domain-containing protein [Colletotrichum higginsianum IMI 349063]
MATRRSHTKSRTGCRDCKRRKVKVRNRVPPAVLRLRAPNTRVEGSGVRVRWSDGTLPTLLFPPARCGVEELSLTDRVHGITCSLSSSSSSGDVSFSTTPQRSSNTPSASGQSPEAPNHFLDVLIHRSRPVPQAPTIELWGHGLELMHHYTLHTANTMSLKPEMQYVWRVAIPEIGYECPFVMHGILAIAALHKAYLLPPERDRYLDLATSHQTAGLEGFRAVLQTLDDSNWESVFCFASITLLHVSFHPVRKSTDHDAELLPDITALFVFVRGIRAILEPYHGGLGRTRLGPMAHGIWVIDPGDPQYQNPSLRHSPLPRDTFDALRRLAAFFEESLPDGTRRGYATAVRELEKSVRLMAHAGTHLEVGMAIFWPYVISDAVMADIQSMNPYAMVLLSHFAVLLRAMEPTYWYLRGWSARLMAAVDQQLAGRPALLEAARWPKEQISELYGPY